MLGNPIALNFIDREITREGIDVGGVGREEPGFLAVLPARNDPCAANRVDAGRSPAAALCVILDDAADGLVAAGIGDEYSRAPIRGGAIEPA